MPVFSNLFRILPAKNIWIVTTAPPQNSTLMKQNFILMK